MYNLKIITLKNDKEPIDHAIIDKTCDANIKFANSVVVKDVGSNNKHQYNNQNILHNTYPMIFVIVKYLDKLSINLSQNVGGALVVFLRFLLGFFVLIQSSLIVERNKNMIKISIPNANDV